MNNVLLLIRLRIKILLRRKTLLLFCLLLPLIFYYLMGQIFTKSADYSRIPIAVVDEDNTPTSREIIMNLQGDGSLLLTVLNKEKSLTLLEDSKVQGVFVLKKGLEEMILKEHLEQLLDVYYLPQNISAPAVTDIVAGDMMSIICNVQASNMAQLYSKKYNSPIKDDVKEYIFKIAEEEKNNNSFALPLDIQVVSPNLLESKSEELDRSLLPKQSVLGLFIIFLTLFLFMNCTSLMREKENKVLARLKSTGCSALEMVLGDTLGIVSVGALLCLIQLVMLYFIFSISSLKILVSLLFIDLIYLLAISLLLIFFTRIFKNSMALQGFMPMFVFFMGLMGGCLWSIELIPSKLHFLSYSMPAFWAQDAISKLVLQGYDIGQLQANMGILLLTTCILFVLNYRKSL